MFLAQTLLFLTTTSDLAVQTPRCLRTLFVPPPGKTGLHPVGCMPGGRLPPRRQFVKLITVLRNAGRQAHADVHAFQLIVRTKEELGPVISGVFLVGHDSDLGFPQRLARLGFLVELSGSPST